MMRRAALLAFDGLCRVSARTMCKPPAKTGCGPPKAAPKKACDPPKPPKPSCGQKPAPPKPSCGQPPAPPKPSSGQPPAPPKPSCGQPPAPPKPSSGQPPAPPKPSCGQPPAPPKPSCGQPPAPPKPSCGQPPAPPKPSCGGSPPPAAKTTPCCNVPTTSEQLCRPPTVAINGFGRIGKCLLRLAVQRDFNVVALNQPFTDAKAIAHSFKHDTIHGYFPGTAFARDSYLCVNGRGIKVFHEEKPENLKWKDVQADYVIDATGKFTEMDSASKHIMAGAKKVIVSAPSSNIPMFVRGVNFSEYKKSLLVVSNASCTTNCAAPLIHIMHKKFGVVNCLLTTTHAVTSSQHVHDGLHHRSALVNIVPSSTGAAKAVGMVIPELKNKVDGDSARVPVSDVSLLKLYMNLKDNVTLNAVKDEIKTQVEHARSDLIAYYDGEKFVSSDFIGAPHSAIVDFSQIQVIDKLVAVGAWYDNEMGYSNRVLDLAKHMMEVDKT